VLAVLVSRAEDIKYRHCLANARRRSRRSTSNGRQQEEQQEQQGSLVQQLVNLRTNKDITPLMMAAESGCADSVRLLLQQVRLYHKQTSSSSSNSSKGTAVHMCAWAVNPV
jgi:ankyrin repeat protein